ncbi:hypothetical protein N7528_005580 [Penicillium herquei]|nr:hypothetical protein N7528_005580 [Penicillium herquei]
MTEDQKNAIIQRLQHCCVESTWGGLSARLSQLQIDLIASILMECLVWTAATSIWKDNPFWFLDGKSSKEDEEGDESFVRRLNHLYKQFYKSNPIAATSWRSDLFRLACPWKNDQSPNWDIGLKHKALREQRYKLEVEKFLSDELVQMLLDPSKKDEIENQRQNELYQTFLAIDDLLVKRLFPHRGHVVFKWKNGVPERYDRNNWSLYPHYLHNFVSDTRVGDRDGHLIILVVMPAIYVEWDTTDNSPSQVQYCEPIVMMDNYEDDLLKKTKAEAAKAKSPDTNSGDRKRKSPASTP